jgi:methylase of polypeptide subunit release factors
VSNLLTYFFENSSLLSQKNIVLTANLPYIKSEDWEHMSADTRYEPALALFGWSETGFELYDELFEQINLLVGFAEISHLTLFLEMGYDQSELAKNSSEKFWWDCELFDDPADIPRFAKITII